MKLILLKERVTKGRKLAIVDDEDFERINKHGWYMSSRGYANRGRRIKRGTWKGKIMMHREVLNLGDDRFVDHINGDRLDNRKKNLRIVTAEQNMANAKIARNNTSGFKGVNRCGKRWQSRIYYKGKRIFLGYCKTAEEAFLLYIKHGQQLKGEYFRMG
jgi:hypothetical protein